MEKNEQYWTSKVQTVNAWMEQNDAGSMSEVLKLQNDLLAANVANPTEAERLWTAIRAIGAMLPNTFVKRGRGSTLSPEIQAAVDSVANAVETAFASFYEANWTLLSGIVLPHGKTGGSYATAQDAAKNDGARASRILKTALKENRWDGSAEDGMPLNLTPPMAPETEGDEEE